MLPLLPLEYLASDDYEYNLYLIIKTIRIRRFLKTFDIGDIMSVFKEIRNKNLETIIEQKQLEQEDSSDEDDLDAQNIDNEDMLIDHINIDQQLYIWYFLKNI